MNRDKLAEKAVRHYFEASRDAHDDKVLLHVPTMMADFALEVLAERDAEIRQAELESLRRTTCPECGCGI